MNPFNNIQLSFSPIFLSMIIIAFIASYLIFKEYKRRKLFNENHPQWEKLNSHWDGFEELKYRSDRQRHERTKKSLIETNNE